MKTTAMPEPQRKLSATETEAAIRIIYISTALYGILEILLVNGFMLLYFSAIGIPSERILLYLAIPGFNAIVTLLLFAQWTERIGKVLTGVIGLSISTSSAVLLILCSVSGKHLVEPLILLSVSIYGVGFGIYLNSWFPMLLTIIPGERRGRFFGTMRLIYQSVAIVFTFVVIWVLSKNASIGIFQTFLAISLILRIIGIILYTRIPELERNLHSKRTFIESILHSVGSPGYMPFCSYVFLLSLFTGACVSLFSLLAKDTLGMSEGQVILIGNLTTLGALIGFFSGGMMVDRIGTKYVFLLCHFSFAIVLILFLFRDFMFLPLIAVVGGLSLLFGLVQAASGVAISSEMLALTPADNKPMSTAICYSLILMGIALSGTICSRMLRLGMLSGSWTLLGSRLGAYDSLLLECGTMVLLLTVTLGLVPSVVKKVQWY